MPQRFYKFIPIIASLIFFACKKEEHFSSRITFFNALVDSPNSPILTLKADSLTIALGIGYDSLITNPSFPSGTFSINLFSSGVSRLNFLTNIQSNATYTWIMYDSVTKAKLYVSTDAIPAAPGVGRCYIRIFNMITSCPGVYLANDTNRTYTPNTTFAFGNFASNSSMPFTEIDTFPNPSMRLDSSRFVARLQQPFRSGKIYSLYLIGSIQDTFPNRVHKPRFVVQTHN